MFDIGGHDYCLVYAGVFQAENAQAICERYGATLPLPINSAQNEDFLQALLDMNKSSVFLGLAEPGRRTFNQTTQVSEGV